MNLDESAIEAAELTIAKQSESRIAQIRAELSEEGEEDCIDCGNPIPPARRAALPSAERCIGCQSRFEKDHRRRA